ncbi:hypothetical protein BT93_I1701 [Corymbia citriodora subsp. variegata]|nr:hypothetical protein BT93_I1701 [Corymbia citriodora subsp. variegata]
MLRPHQIKSLPPGTIVLSTPASPFPPSLAPTPELLCVPFPSPLPTLAPFYSCMVLIDFQTPAQSPPFPPKAPPSYVAPTHHAHVIIPPPPPAHIRPTPAMTPIIDEHKYMNSFCLCMQ